MLFNTLSVALLLTVGVAASPLVENRGLVAIEPRGEDVAPDRISTRSKWTKRDGIAARKFEQEHLTREVAPDRISTRSKWTKREELAARNIEPAADAELVARDSEASAEDDVIIDCCISTRSMWDVEEDS